MGNKHGRNKSSKHGRTDDTFDISSDSELVRSFIKQNSFVQRPLLHLPTPTFNLKQIDDRRQYHPEPFARPAGSLKRSATRLVAPAAKTSQRLSNRLPAHPQVQFAAPKHVVVCVRRKQRREVLFAKQKTGRGAKSRKSFNEWSSVKC